MRRFIDGLIVATLAATVLATGPTPANAYSTEDVTSISVILDTDAIGYATALTLEFDKPVSSAEASELKGEVMNVTNGASTSRGFEAKDASVVNPALAGPAGAYFKCKADYRWWDANAEFGTQRNCKSIVASWYVKLQPAVQAIVVGDVKELGMGWKRNGVQQARQAPRIVPASYILHGSFGVQASGQSFIE